MSNEASPRFAQGAELSRALVTADTEEAHSWWACSLVASAHGRPPPLEADTLEEASPAVAASVGAALLTPHQARRLGARTGAPFSAEYTYLLAALADCTDRTFKKACRKADAALAESALTVQVYAGLAISDELVGRCQRCRRCWMDTRAKGARQKAKREKVTYRGPPWAGVTTRAGFLCAATQLRVLADGRPNLALALLVVSAAPSPAGAGTAPPVVAYVLTERVGRTIVAVDGLHDYSCAGVDPSALLLRHAARWWSAADDPDGSDASPPLWLNDGPVPTPGLLAYKSQFHGALLHVYSLKTQAQARAAARARWAAALAAWRRRQRVHVGAHKIRRAAKRIYGVGW